MIPPIMAQNNSANSASDEGDEAAAKKKLISFWFDCQMILAATGIFCVWFVMVHRIRVIMKLVYHSSQRKATVSISTRVVD